MTSNVNVKLFPQHRIPTRYQGPLEVTKRKSNFLSLCVMHLPTDWKTLVMIFLLYLVGQGTVRGPGHHFSQSMISRSIERGGLIVRNCVQMSFGTEIVLAKLALTSDNEIDLPQAMHYLVMRMNLSFM